jgi:hypothetical protein
MHPMWAATAILMTMLVSGSAAADEAANVTTAKRVFLEKMGQGRFDRLDEIYGPGFVGAAAAPTRWRRGGCPARAHAPRSKA